MSNLVIEADESFYLDEKLLNIDKPIKILGLNCPNYDNPDHFETKAIDLFKAVKTKISESEEKFILGFYTDYMSESRNELILPDFGVSYPHMHHSDDLLFEGFLIWGFMEETSAEILARYEEGKEVSREK